MYLRIGTRGSKLALAQSTWAKGKIEAQHPDARVSLVRIRTKGDKILDSPLSRIGGKGLFVKEIEDALLRGEVDLAVHSMKDVPAELPEGLELAVFPERADPRDAFVSIQYKAIEELPEGSSVGTGSLRRSAQISRMRPDLKILPLRGNVDTRLKKLGAGAFQALVLAAAGLHRLGLSDRIRQVFSPEEFLPAIGQGALGLEVRKGNRAAREMLGFLNHEETELSVRAERAFLQELEGGCQIPIAGHGRLEGDTLILSGMVAGLDGKRIVRDQVQGPKERPEALGIDLARLLLKAGADILLEEVYKGGGRM